MGKFSITNDTDLIVDEDFDATPESLVAEEFVITPEVFAAILEALETKGRWRGKLAPSFGTDRSERMTRIRLPTKEEQAAINDYPNTIKQLEENSPSRAAWFREQFIGHKERAAARRAKPN